jgi:hypothetical protein
MKAYVLTEDQMRAYWALERRAERPDMRQEFSDELVAIEDANEVASPLPTDGAARVAAERLSHPERGWTADHDRGHEAELIRASLAYTAVAADLAALGGSGPTRLTADDAGFPWAEHYFRPRATVVGNLDKSAALLIAAADTIEAKH